MAGYHEDTFWEGEREEFPEIPARELAKKIIIDWIERLPLQDHFVDQLHSSDSFGPEFGYDILCDNVKHAVRLVEKYL